MKKIIISLFLFFGLFLSVNQTFALADWKYNIITSAYDIVIRDSSNNTLATCYNPYQGMYENYWLWYYYFWHEWNWNYSVVVYLKGRSSVYDNGSYVYKTCLIRLDWNNNVLNNNSYTAWGSYFLPRVEVSQGILYFEWGPPVRTYKVDPTNYIPASSASFTWVAPTYLNVNTEDYWSAWPPALDINSQWNITFNTWSVSINNLDTTTDFNLTYTINDLTNNYLSIDSWNLWSFSWWLNTINFYDKWDLIFTNWIDYKITLNLTNYEDINDTEQLIYTFNFNPSLKEYCYTKPIKDSLLNVNTQVTKIVWTDFNSYSFTNSGVLDLVIWFENWLDNYETWTIVNELSINWFNTDLLTLDREINFTLPIIDWTYEMFLGSITNITWIKSDLWLVYNTDFDLWKITIPWNINKFKLDWNFLISPYSQQLIIFKNSDYWEQFCFSVTDTNLQNIIDNLQLQEDTWIISTDDFIYNLEDLLNENNISTTQSWSTVDFVWNNVVPQIDWTWIFDFFFNPLKEMLNSTAYKFLTDLLLLNELPSSTNWKVTFNLIKPVINSD